MRFEPDENRQMSRVHVFTKAKLAAVKGTSTVMYLARVRGKSVAVESNPQQMTLLQPGPPAVLVPMPDKEY